MTTGPGRLLSALALTLLLAWGSVLSAAHMAPSERELARAQAVMVFGYADLCAHDMHDNTHAGSHHCPFCHALPEPPAVSIDPAQMTLIHAAHSGPAGHLVRARAPCNTAHGTRAPPVFAI